MNDLDALYQAILAQPLEDTPRLMYADCLDETGGQANHDRAEFIRAQIKLYNIGPPRIYHKNCMLIPHGPDYYEVDVTNDDGSIKVGDRVDIRGEIIGKMSPRSKAKLYPGLLVMRVFDEDFGTVRLALKQDEWSVPYPKKEVKQLQKRCEELAHKNPKTLGDRPYHVGYYTARYVRGFLSQMTCGWSCWAANGDRTVASFPITHVELITDVLFDMRSDGVKIADQRIPWSYLLPERPHPYDLSSTLWVEDHIDVLLSLRWPTVPMTNWTLTEQQQVEDE